MTARIFISYRSADGADKATALARDLGRLFGAAQVFIDKDDLTGGVRWADEVARALQARPVLLLLVTPGLLAQNPATGRRQLDDPQAPVRREITAALAAGAVVVPVLCDGVDSLPAGLPPPLDVLGERTWRRLRAYDWAGDLRRIEQDLLALGLPPQRHPAARRAVLVGVLLLGAAGAGLWWWQQPPADPLTGRWQGRIGADDVLLVLQRDGDQLRLESAPIHIRQRADWADYRQFWRERDGGQAGGELDAVRWRGAGTARAAVGSPLAIDVALTVLSVPGDVPVDGGNLSATLMPDGRLQGTRWFNGAQAEVPAVLTRSH
ncbi:MAG: toll/interleukin-1 receptor domain-containing protein [Rubrivivax sp.]|nr:toll/interleukin-1 receptor domain-containing protein [Rubrivivax sp.]